MRLGYYRATTASQLDELPEKLDAHGCSAVWADGIDQRTDYECAALKERSQQLGIVLGEAGMWENLMTGDAEKRRARIERVRRMLRKADLAGVKCVVTLVGTKDASEMPLAPHPYMYTKAAKSEFREVVLRILDGLDLKVAGYGVEPWHNTFYYQPEQIREFIDSVGHPKFGVHLDQMNMVSQESFYNTTDLINKTFDLLADKIWSVHLKDIRCDFTHMFLKWDEVRIGEGVMDYATFLRRIAALPEDTTCFCEHFKDEADYAICFSRLHALAEKAGVSFLRRSVNT